MTPFASSMLAAAIAALGLAPAPVSEPLPSEWVGKWELDPDPPDKCVLKRIHDGGTRILVYGPAGGIRTLILNNPGWPEPSLSGPYQLVSRRGRERLALPPDGRKVDLDAEMAARVIASDSIEVVRPDGSVVERVDLSGIASAEARLPACMARVAERPWIVMPAPSAPVPASRELDMPVRARPHSDLATLFSADDYPEAAWRAKEEGRVGFLLVIGEAGRVESCSITSSSGSAALDSATCPLLVERARFEPARDHRGRPTADRAAGGIVWRLPKSAPSPPPLRLGLERPARAKVALHTLFTDLDYPSAAVRAGEQGTVGFQLLVGADGRVTGCRITASSGSESLDSATCQGLSARALFEPARDREGRPAADSVNGRIVWSMESGPPPPPSE